MQYSKLDCVQSLRYSSTHIYSTCTVQVAEVVVTLNDNIAKGIYVYYVQFTVSPAHFHAGSPNCPEVYTTGDAAFLTVTVQKSQMMWLPEWYCVEVISHNELTASIVHNVAPKAAVSFNVTSLQPGTIYNISVIPCNMAGCNESCDIHSVLTESGGKIYTCVQCSYRYIAMTV